MRSAHAKPLNGGHMVPLVSLLIPILLSAVIVFIVSSVIHMASPWHKNDYARVPDEDRLREALIPLAIPPGEYLVPRARERAEMTSTAYIGRVNQGPNLLLTVLPNGPMPISRNLIQWFLYLLVVSIFSAYVAGRALAPGTDYLEVFRFVGTSAFLAFAVALWQMSIWYRRSWKLTFAATLDGLIYALLFGGTFGWLWPR
jgi:hypothetical protein